MRRILPVSLIVSMLCLIPILAACQPRMPLARTEAASAARNWCLRDGHNWGDVVSISAPGAADDKGRTWWTVHFAGPDHVVLVDAESGWVKQAH